MKKVALTIGFIAVMVGSALGGLGVAGEGASITVTPESGEVATEVLVEGHNWTASDPVGVFIDAEDAAHLLTAATLNLSGESPVAFTEWEAETTNTVGSTASPDVLRTATQVVAASDSSSTGKAVADQVCDGIADNVQIQAAVDALPSGGGIVQLLEGTFSITASITVPSDVTLQGIGPSTLLELDFDGHIFVNSTTDARRITIRNLRVDGKDRDYYAVYFDQGASLTYDPDHVFEHLYIERMNAIYHRGNLGNIRIYDVKSLGGQGYAFALYSPDNILIACEAGKRVYHTNNPSQGYHLIGKSWLVASTAYAADTGIYITGEGNIINSVISELNRNQGVYLEDAEETYITQLHSRRNSSLSIGAEPDIKMVGTSVRNRITDSFFDGSNQTKYHIEESASSDYNIIESNSFMNSVIAPILKQGSNTVVRYNHDM